MLAFSTPMDFVSPVVVAVTPDNGGSDSVTTPRLFFGSTHLASTSTFIHVCMYIWTNNFVVQSYTTHPTHCESWNSSTQSYSQSTWKGLIFLLPVQNRRYNFHHNFIDISYFWRIHHLYGSSVSIFRFCRLFFFVLSNWRNFSTLVYAPKNSMLKKTPLESWEIYKYKRITVGFQWCLKNMENCSTTVGALSDLWSIMENGESRHTQMVFGLSPATLSLFTSRSIL